MKITQYRDELNQALDDIGTMSNRLYELHLVEVEAQTEWIVIKNMDDDKAYSELNKAFNYAIWQINKLNEQLVINDFVDAYGVKPYQLIPLNIDTLVKRVMQTRLDDKLKEINALVKFNRDLLTFYKLL